MIFIFGIQEKEVFYYQTLTIFSAVSKILVLFEARAKSLKREIGVMRFQQSAKL
jgi:hypothetical protein